MNAIVFKKPCKVVSDNAASIHKCLFKTGSLTLLENLLVQKNNQWTGREV